MKTTYVLKMETTVVVSDNGYLGDNATLAEHKKQAKEQLNYYTWLLKRGSQEAKPHHVKMTVEKIIMEEV